MEDQQLIAVLDSRFGALIQQLDWRFEQLDRRFEQIDRRFEQIDRRFEQVDKRFERIDGRLETLETGLRQANVQIEDLRGQMQQLAESVMHIDDRVGRFQQETLREFYEVKSFNRLSYTLLETHMKSHDRRLADLDARVGALETKH